MTREQAIDESVRAGMAHFARTYLGEHPSYWHAVEWYFRNRPEVCAEAIGRIFDEFRQITKAGR